MPDQTSNGHSSGELPYDDDQSRIKSDLDRRPRLVSVRLGSRLMSLSALMERVVAEFRQEYVGTAELAQASTPASRLKLILTVIDYVIAVESVQLSVDNRAELVNQVFSNLFGYGPLDPWLVDNRITTISLDGPDRVAVRYGHGDLTPVGPLFEDIYHLQEIIQRLLTDAGAEMRPEHPIIEVGLMVADRPICLNTVCPPVALQLGADIRLHPVVPPTAESLIADGFLDARILVFLNALIVSPYGALITGDPESGKTTLLSVLANLFPSSDGLHSVERAGELRLPSGATRHLVQWPLGDQPGMTYGDQVTNALQENPACLLLDEVRADEPAAIALLLQPGDVPRQFWSFRSSVFIKRLQSALTMLARRADPTAGDESVRQLFDRLPFVLAVNRTTEGLRLWSIGEWQFRYGSGAPSLVPLMERDAEGVHWTGEQPSRSLLLPADFWI